MTQQPVLEDISARFADLKRAHFIDGKWVSDGDQQFSLVNPTTGDAVGQAPIASAAVVEQAVQAAQTAFQTWRLTTPRERGEYLLRLADRISEASEDLAQLETWNVGKPISNAREEMPLMVDLLRFYAGAVRVTDTTGAGEYEQGTTSILLREPIGVVGLIVPWNYPLLMALWKIAPALAAGNTVVIKPSEQTPFTALLMTKLAEDVFPPGVLNLVLGDGSTGAAIVEHPSIGMVSLTGDSSTGKKIASGASESLKRVHLELGGKAPVLVFADADIDYAAEYLAMAGFVNTGQDCTAACRLIVHDSVYERFVERFIEEVQRLQVGDPSEPATQMGPLITERQMERVLGFLERARATSAQVRTGGIRMDRPGFFVEPTVVTDVEQTHELVQKEVFGPVVTVQRASSDEEMLQWANDVNYGLSASIWTADLARTMQFTKSLSYGTVWVNGHLSTVAEMPFGGFGQSGYGKELSTHSIDEYSQFKHVMIYPNR